MNCLGKVGQRSRTLRDVDHDRQREIKQPARADEVTFRITDLPAHGWTSAPGSHR
jgi:hypothetical protein